MIMVLVLVLLGVSPALGGSFFYSKDGVWPNIVVCDSVTLLLVNVTPLPRLTV